MKKPKKDEINGSHLQGNFKKPYLELIKILGKPDYDYRRSDELTDNKISVEWEFKFSDGTDDIMATIYNWKDGINYDDQDGVEVEKLTNWHIGGHSKKAVEKVLQLVN